MTTQTSRQQSITVADLIPCEVCTDSQPAGGYQFIATEIRDGIQCCKDCAQAWDEMTEVPAGVSRIFTAQERTPPASRRSQPMLGMTIRNPQTGALESVELCEVCWDERDEPATEERDGIPCCKDCARAWDEMEQERSERAAAVIHRHICPCGVVVDDRDFDRLCEEQMAVRGETACVYNLAWCDAHPDGAGFADL